MARTVRRTVRCTRAERARIRERADALGMTVSGFVVACALHGDRADRAGHALALSADEQRLLFDRVAELDRVRRALHEGLPGTELSLFGAVAFLQRAFAAGGSGR